MRILFARLMVVVTGLLIVMLAILFAVIRNTPVPPSPASSDEARMAVPEIDAAPMTNEPAGRPRAAAIARGEAVYVEQRCRMCHSLGGEGTGRSRLDDVGRRLTEREIRLWIVAPQEMDPAVAKRGYRLSPDDLDAIVAYLMSKRSHEGTPAMPPDGGVSHAEPQRAYIWCRAA